jgi:hypothetical protein
MKDLVLLDRSQIKQASLEQLKAELSRSLKVTSDYLIYMSVIWSELNDRGVDLSHLNSNLFQYIPLIAANKLDARLVVEFAGNKTLLTAFSKIDMDLQAQIVETKSVPFVEINEDNTVTKTQLDLTTAKAQQIYQVFGGEDNFRDAHQQHLYLIARTKTKKYSKRDNVSVIRTVTFDQNNRYMLLGGNQKVKMETLLSAIGDLYGVDMFEIMSKYSDRIAKEKKTLN